MSSWPSPALTFLPPAFASSRASAARARGRGCSRRSCPSSPSLPGKARSRGRPSFRCRLRQWLGDGVPIGHVERQQFLRPSEIQDGLGLLFAFGIFQGLQRCAHNRDRERRAVEVGGFQILARETHRLVLPWVRSFAVAGHAGMSAGGYPSSRRISLMAWRTASSISSARSSASSARSAGSVCSARQIICRSGRDGHVGAVGGGHGGTPRPPPTGPIPSEFPAISGDFLNGRKKPPLGLANGF